ncbi:hypothetical protein TWF225_007936 [Orbilia oligospora]|nr:hypothetical protein TWF751_012081 [Orbilia oligospora]KAF3178170.1 hypothetical protein TWF225_007936 [Orbilia oligospora]KAF3248439.1 hypothetical protein TWF128_008418 [Orbilia oligospora]KAF3256567.1 hypothetical protein TWF217_006262 [Orbilia oligospora]
MPTTAMGLERPDPSIVSTSSIGGDKSMLSLQTKSSYSIPDDGRAITIETNKKHHQKQIVDTDAASAVSQNSQTSLLIEYFEGARGQGSAPSHRPSVRVKVTPSSHRRASQQARAIELGPDGRPVTKRAPSYTQRISLSNPRNEDRLIVAKDRRKRRSEAGGSDMTLSRGDDDFTSEVSEQSQSLVHPPMKIDVIREGPGSPLGSPRYYRTNSGPRGRRKTYDDGDSGLHPLSQRRSRSLSNERELMLGEGSNLGSNLGSNISSNLSRKRSQSLDRDREGLTKEQRRERRRLEKKMAEFNGEPSTRSREIKSPRDRHGRSMSRDGGRRKVSGTRNISNASDLAQNPVLLEAVEDAIKRLILPQFEALKASNQAGNTSAIDQAASAAIAAEAARAFAKKRSAGKSEAENEGPMLVLQPDADMGTTGYGVVLSQSDNSALLRSESVRSRGPGFGPGPAPGSDLADGAPAVEPLDGLFGKHPSAHEQLRMPSIPSMASSNRSEHENNVHADIEGAPYPTAERSGMPTTGNTPPPISMPEVVAPLNISRRGTPASNLEQAPTPKRSFASIRRQFDAQGLIQVAPLSPRKYTFAAKSEASVASASTAQSWHPNKSSHYNRDDIEARDKGVQSRSELPKGASPRGDAMNWWFEGNKDAPTQPGTEVDQSIVGQSVADQSVVAHSYAGQSYADQSYADQSYADQSVVDQSVVDQSAVGYSAVGTSVVDDSAVGYDPNHYQYGDYGDSDVGLTVPNMRAGSALSVPSHRGTGSSTTEVHKIQLDPPDTTSHFDEEFENRSENRDSIPGSFEARHSERVAAGQNVRDVGAYASMRNTPVDVPSQRASVYDNLSDVHGQHSHASLLPQERAMSPASTVLSEAPKMGFNAAPVYGYDDPAYGHYQSRSDLGLGRSELGDEDDVVTNPYGADRSSQIMPNDDAITNPYTDNRMSRDMSVLSGVDDMTTNPYGADRTSREIAMEGGDQHWGYAEDDHTGSHNANFGHRALQAGHSGGDFTGDADQDSLIDRENMLTPLPMDREGYNNSANPLSPESDDGIQTGLKGISSFGGIGIGGLDDVSEDGDEFTPFRGHARPGSSNSHGMPSPLYDSALGRGIDRIQSKDIVALMDHLTVRDAARNARDTEILMTLVRSAAEMRDSFDDLKKQLAAHSSQIVLEIDQGAEKTVAKLGAPRPVIPLPISRQIRAPRNFDEEKEEAHKKTNIFRKALKGLSMKSGSDLARIEDMLVQLLGEVEGLKAAASYAYTESNTASHAGDHVQIPVHTQSIRSQQSHQSYNNASANNLGAVDYSAAAGIGQRIMNSNGELNYHYGIANPVTLQQVTNVITRGVTPNDDGMRTPRGYRDVQPEQGPARSVPTIQTIQTPIEPVSPPVPQNSSQFNDSPNTDKGKKRESGQKASRWSETTTSSGFKSFFTRKKKGESMEQSRTNSEFEEDWAGTPQMGTAENSPYPQHSRQVASPIYEKPSLEANRRSLEIKQPKPIVHHSRYKLEQAAETHIDTQSPALTQSTTSLKRFMQHGGSYNNITSLAPMFPDTGESSNSYSQNYQQQGHQSYQSSQDHYSTQPGPSNINDYYSPQQEFDDRTVTPQPPQTAQSVQTTTTVDEVGDLSYVTERKKKTRHKRDETPDERAARRERRRQRHRSRELLGEVPREEDEDMMGSRPASAASRKYTRPLSAASHRSYRANDDAGSTNSNRHRTSHLTHITTGKLLSRLYSGEPT